MSLERRTPWVDWTEADVAALVSRTLSEVRAVSRLEGGRANSVFLATLTDETRVVVRAATRDPRSAAKERALAGTLADPTWMPRCLAHTVSPDGVPVSFWAYASGTTLAEAWPQLNAAARVTLAAELGTVLADLRTHTYSVHGDLVADESGALAVTPWGFASDGGDERLAFTRHCLFESPAGDRLGSALRDRLWAYIQECAQRWPVSGPTLVHADFGPTNLIVHGGHLTAVLDWEFAHAGDPAADLGNLFRARPDVEWTPDEAQAVATSMRGAGVELASDWPAQARALDLTSACEFLSSEQDRPQVHERARHQIVQTLARDA